MNALIGSSRDIILILLRHIQNWAKCTNSVFTEAPSDLFVFVTRAHTVNRDVLGASFQLRHSKNRMLFKKKIKKNLVPDLLTLLSAVVVSLLRLGYRQSFNHAVFSRNALWFSCPHGSTKFMWKFVCTFLCCGTLCALFYLFWHCRNPLSDSALLLWNWLACGWKKKIISGSL